MKAVTRQRPKNANYSVSSNPTHTNGAPLKAKPRTRQPEKLPQRPKQQQKQPKVEGEGGKMTKFRSLDDIPDFTDDFGKDKSDFEIPDSPYQRSDNHSAPSHYNHVPAKAVSSYSNMNDKRAPPPALRGHPPPLPAEEDSLPPPYNNKNLKQNQKQMEQHPSPQRKNNAPPPCYDNSCDSVDTDFSDDDDDDCNHSYFSSTDDYHVDYTPKGAKQNNQAAPKGRVVRPVKPVQNSYPAKQQPAQYDNRDGQVNQKVPKEPREISYKPYTIQQYRKIKPQEYVEFSKLKPDLNTTELVAKRANAERIKQFSKNLNDFNRVSIKNNVSADEKEANNQVKVLSNREKARQFAQNVPKPKVIDKAMPASGYKMERNIGLSAVPTSKIDELTSRHQQSKKQVEAIKKSMGL